MVWYSLTNFRNSAPRSKVLTLHIFSNANSRIWFFLFSKIRTAVYPSNKARIGAKLWQNAFRKICNFSFFDATFFFLENKNAKKMLEVEFYFWKSCVLEEPWICNPRWQMRSKKLLPEVSLFLGRLPLRRGKRLNMCRKPRLGTENDFNHSVVWLDDNMIIW